MLPFPAAGIDPRKGREMDRARPQRLIWTGLLTVVAWACFAASGNGARLLIHFDFPHAVECHDVTTPEFARLYAGEKIIKVRFHVSTRIVSGDERDLSELLVQIRTSSERVRVVSFAPRTTLKSDTVGSVDVKTTSEVTTSGGVSLGGSLPLPCGSFTFQSRPTSDIARTRRDVRAETSQVVPARRAVIVSGTMANQHGVFFKLRPWHGASMEDLHYFTIYFAVPRQWRGDWVQLTCRAFQPAKHLRPKSLAGHAVISQGVYMAGDVEAKRATHQLAHAQTDFLEESRQSTRPFLSRVVARCIDQSKSNLAGCLRCAGLGNAAEFLFGDQRTEVNQRTQQLQVQREVLRRLGHAQ